MCNTRTIIAWISTCRKPTLTVVITKVTSQILQNQQIIVRLLLHLLRLWPRIRMNFLTIVLVAVVLVYSACGKDMKEGRSDASLYTLNRVSIEWFPPYIIYHLHKSLPDIHLKVRVNVEKDKSHLDVFYAVTFCVTKYWKKLRIHCCISVETSPRLR